MPFSLTLSHVGIFVSNLPAMEDFYTRFMGFAVSDRGRRPDGAEIVFLTRDPGEHHQLVLVSGRPESVGFNVVNQLSFRVDSLATLRALYEGLEHEAVSGIETLTHGNALSVYFRDPEGNRVELLIDTPWYVPQPHYLDVDLTAPDEALWAAIERHVRATPGFMPVAQWRAETERRIAQATAARGGARARVAG
ncbi:MAG TPA: VOC family protein [Burkholderiales bacterium]|nr:VOC family protein [Burkholderiales bacterium]